MALIKCPECNRQVSEIAEYCPQCGAPVAKIVMAQKESNLHKEESAETIEKNDEFESTSPKQKLAETIKKNAELECAPPHKGDIDPSRDRPYGLRFIIVICILLFGFLLIKYYIPLFIHTEKIETAEDREQRRLNNIEKHYAELISYYENNQFEDFNKKIKEFTFNNQSHYKDIKKLQDNVNIKITEQKTKELEEKLEGLESNDINGHVRVYRKLYRLSEDNKNNLILYLELKVEAIPESEYASKIAVYGELLGLDPDNSTYLALKEFYGTKYSGQLDSQDALGRKASAQVQSFPETVSTDFYPTRTECLGAIKASLLGINDTMTGYNFTRKDANGITVEVAMSGPTDKVVLVCEKSPVGSRWIYRATIFK